MFSRISTLLIFPAIVAVFLFANSTSSHAQRLPQRSSQPGMQGPRGQMPPMNIKLTDASVKKLLVVLPALSAVRLKHRKSNDPSGGMMGGMPGGSAINKEEFKAVSRLLKKHDMRMDEFGMQVSALMATYMIMDPKAADAMLPTLEKPQIKKMLADPKVPQEQKDALRMQITMLQKNKGMMLQQFAQLATPENRAVVSRHLPAVRKLFAEMEKDSSR